MPGDIYGQFYGPSGVGPTDYSGMGPAGWMSGQWGNYSESPDAMNPWNIINAIQDQTNYMTAHGMGKVANKFGAMGLGETGNTGYMRALADVAGNYQNQANQQYYDAVMNSQKWIDQMSMQGAQGLANQGQYYQNAAYQPITMLNQFGGQEYALGQEAMNRQYDEWLRQMYGNRDFALNLLGNPGATTAATIRQRGGGGTDWGSILGTIGTIAAMYFGSDERIKENIKTVGHKNGLRIVEFNYKGGSQKYIGVIAQEVEAEHPYAVFETGGYKRVNYAALPLWRS